jgi:hypothetical protein
MIVIMFREGLLVFQLWKNIFTGWKNSVASICRFL